MEDDLVTELFEAEWKKKKERILETKKFETEDFLEYAILTLLDTTRTINHELGQMATKEQMAGIQAQMVTKNSLYAGITIIGVIFASLQLLIQLLI